MPSGTIPASSLLAASCASSLDSCVGRPLRLQHIQPDQQQDDSTRNLERRQRNPEHAKDVLSLRPQTRSEKPAPSAKPSRPSASPARIRPPSPPETSAEPQTDPPEKRSSSEPAPKTAHTPSAAAPEDSRNEDQTPRPILTCRESNEANKPAARIPNKLLK